MAQQIGYYTEEGMQKMKDELHQLRTTERKAATQAIVDARDKGDLSENAEYDAAREAQVMLEFRIAKLEDVIANARIVDETKIDLSKVSILTTVKIINVANKSAMKYTLVAENEANLKLGKISVDSPIGKALLGKKIGDNVDVQVPVGKVTFQISEITI
jgi:transcription elongation factor GreA